MRTIKEYTQYMYFQWLPVGAMFLYNGNECKKVSTRTAEYLAYGRRFYFAKNDLAIVGEYSRLF